MLASERTEQKTGFWHIDVFAKIKARWSRITSLDLQYLRRFQSDYGYKSFSILTNFENFPPTRRFPFNRSRLNKFLA